jgi:AraC-like DNA-binding protein
MYAPVLLPQTPAPSPEVLATEQRLRDAEGAYHVEGHYFANLSDAERARRIVAERLVREASRREQWTAQCTARQPLARPRAATWLPSRERQQVAAAGGDALTLIHCDTLAAVANECVTGRADAVLVSVAHLTPADLPALARLVTHFPGTPVAGLIGGDATHAGAITGALLLGRAGIQTVVDCRTREGWSALRATFAPRNVPDAFLRACVACVLSDLRTDDGADVSADQPEGKGSTERPACPDGLVRFFITTFAPDVSCAKVLASRLGVLPSTLMSRFFRAGLPSPKRYVALARLVWAARLGEAPGLSISNIANQLDASSPQSFHRTVRTMTGRPASEFRRTMTGGTMLAQFRATLVAPYRDALRTFDPLAVEPRTATPRQPDHRALGSAVE